MTRAAGQVAPGRPAWGAAAPCCQTHHVVGGPGRVPLRCMPRHAMARNAPERSVAAISEGALILVRFPVVAGLPVTQRESATPATPPKSSGAFLHPHLGWNPECSGESRRRRNLPCGSCREPFRTAVPEVHSPPQVCGKACGGLLHGARGARRDFRQGNPERCRT
ncbi:MAG: hypothetical protein PWR07_45 [Bacillota bacterium]|nr:hypothetical protein [Bacillota bacterium]